MYITLHEEDFRQKLGTVPHEYNCELNKRVITLHISRSVNIDVLTPYIWGYWKTVHMVRSMEGCLI
jgi:hypothetical protein